MEELRKDNNFDEIDKEIIGSCAINFFFGAGVNGDAFRMAKDFNKTLKILENILGENVKLEEGFTKITSDEHYEEAKQCFIDEIKEAYNEYNINKSQSLSIKNIKELFEEVYKIVNLSENRCPRMKLVNIFTLNYDTVIEDSLDELGYFYNQVSSTNYAKKRNVYDVVGYDIDCQKNMPTFLISHLHGDLNEPIIPGNKKYEASINADNFEIVYNTKRILCRPNSIFTIIQLADCNSDMIDIIPALVSKMIFDRAVQNKGNNDIAGTITNIVIDEAHNLLYADFDNNNFHKTTIDVFEKIVKEGRKFGIFLTISSQRPSDISNTIISQLHNYFVHRLVNPNDLDKIKKSVAYLDSNSLDFLTVLSQGECVISGNSINLPQFVQVDRLIANGPYSSTVELVGENGILKKE